jgi:hypothetical protein
MPTLPADATFAYHSDLACWEIDLGAPASGSVEALNQEVDHATQAFLHAFGEMCAVEEAGGDIFLLDDDGRVLSVLEGVHFAPTGDGRFRPDLQHVDPALNGTPLITRLTLSCSAIIVRADRKPLILPAGARFYYDSVVDFNLGERVEVVDSSVGFCVNIDPWLDVTLEPGSYQGRDNQSVSQLNRPRLEHALRDWEALMGRSIVETTSGLYRARLHRYGFTAG